MAKDSSHREPDPSTDVEESAFHEQVRDILGMSPFDRHEQIYEELRRLKAIEKLSASWL